MASATDTHLLLRAFVDELARCGMRDACTSPGSRCAPLVLALAREPGLRAWSHVDERCAGFFALGVAKASGRPVAVAVTSGTAAAELAPAVHEAHEARVPLLVLTADRPPELREVGAGQTIDQIELYGSAAKWFFEVGDHPATPERLRWMRALACRAYWTAAGDRRGVVHLNFPLREPLVPPGPLAPDRTGRPDRAPQLARPGSTTAIPDPVTQEELVGLLERRPRGQVAHTAGEVDRPRVAGAAVPADVRRQRPIAFAQPRDDPGPARPGVAEPVQEDDPRRHADTMTPDRDTPPPRTGGVGGWWTRR